MVQVMGSSHKAVNTDEASVLVSCSPPAAPITPKFHGRQFYFSMEVGGWGLDTAVQVHISNIFYSGYSAVTSYSNLSYSNYTSYDSFLKKEDNPHRRQNSTLHRTCSKTEDVNLLLHILILQFKDTHLSFNMPPKH